MDLEALAHVSRAVVDARVEAELAHHEVALRLAARDADDAATLELRHLAHRLPHGPRRTGHHHRLARLRLADVEQPEVARHTGHAQRVEPLLQWRDRGVDLHHPGVARGGGIEESEFLHAEAGADEGAHRVVGVSRGHDAPHAARAHHLTQADRGNVALALVHPPAHRRVERQHQRLHQVRPVADLGHRLFGELPVGRLGQPHWSSCEAHLVVHGRDGGLRHRAGLATDGQLGTKNAARKEEQGAEDSNLGCLWGEWKG